MDSRAMGFGRAQMNIKLVVVKFHDDLNVFDLGPLHEVQCPEGALKIESLVGIDGPENFSAKVQLCIGVLHQHPHKSFHFRNFGRNLNQRIWKVIHK